MGLANDLKEHLKKGIKSIDCVVADCESTRLIMRAHREALKDVLIFVLEHDEKCFDDKLPKRWCS